MDCKFIVISVSRAGHYSVEFCAVGFQLEQRQFEQSLDQTLLDFRSMAEGDSELSDKLVALFREPEKFFVVKRDSTLDKATEDVRAIFSESLKKNGIDVEVDFAITGKGKKPIYLVSESYDSDLFKFNEHTVALAGRLATMCRCTLYLHVYSEELTSYVMNRLGYLIWPSVLFILAIVVCLVLLILTLNKQQKLNQIKNDFINNLTHELKTPVFSISLATKMLRNKFSKSSDEKAKNFINIIDKENEQLKGHIDRVLELASLEIGQQHLDKEPTDLNQLIQEVTDSNQLKIRHQNGVLHFAKAELDKKINLDKAHFKNVIQNLIDNAIKYGQSNPKIEITTEQQKRTLRHNGKR